MEITFNHFDYLRELEQQRKLFNECFPETEGTESGTKEHYFWKFHSNKFRIFNKILLML